LTSEGREGKSREEGGRAGSKTKGKMKKGGKEGGREGGRGGGREVPLMGLAFPPGPLMRRT